MKELFVVTRRRGTAWDASKPLGSQEQWTEHAAFMNGLACDGFIVLGGPVGDGSDTLLIIDAPNKNAITATLSGDPWSRSGMLELSQIQRWTVLLEAKGVT
jgi:uncharacterized protein YciI